MFSVCIPTMNRYDNYLSKFLPLYLKNDLIDEIIISDENGNDYNKLMNYFPNNDKIKLYKNEVVLGPFLNKLNVCKKASKQWIVLIDSDNFADNDYFIKIKEYIDMYNPPENSILSPDYGNEIFKWKHLSSLPPPTNVINKSTYNQLKILDDIQSKKYNGTTGCISHLMNLGNYVINKHLINNIDVSNETFLTKNSDCFDVVLFNLLCFEQLNMNFYIINNLKYTHTTSNDSIYLKTINKLRPYAENTYNRLYKFFE